MNKNPLTLNKIVAGLPRNNLLVSQYHALKKEQTTLLSKYNGFMGRISEKLEMFKI